jgi:CRP-like cAMP-binding protein
LSLATLEEIARLAREVRFDAGDLLMREGEPGDRYLVLISGVVQVTQAGRRLRDLGPGDGLGEIALLRPTPRTATARARTEVRAYALDASAFIAAVSRHRIAWARAQSLVEERLAVVAD